MCRVSTYWTEDLYNEFVKLALLSPEEAYIMKLVIQKFTIKEIADQINRSTSTVSRRVNILRGKYDNLVALYPNKFPARREEQIKPERR